LAGSNSQPFEVNDFSKGITDDVYDQVPATFAVLDNFLIGGDKRPYSRFGSEVENIDYPEIPTGVRVGALINYANNEKLLYQSLREIYYRNPDSFTELIGPTGNNVFSEGGIESEVSTAQWNRHVYLTSDSFPKPMKLFKDGSGEYQVRNSGLPAMTVQPTATAGNTGDQSFIYAIYYSDDYTVFALTYQTVGPITATPVSNCAAPELFPITISNIQEITNGPTDNYNVSGIKAQIYRTTNGGTFFRKVGEVANGVTTFVDSMSDATLVDTGIPLYTNDGTVDFDPPPLHKYAHVVNNTAYYAHIIDEDGESPYRIRQSVPGVPDSAPIDFVTEVDDEIKGLNSVQSIPLVFCKKYIYRLDGFFDQFGRGGTNAIRISDNAGLISNSSVVACEGSVFFFGNDGVYTSDGYKCMKVSDQLNARYKDFIKNTTKQSRIIGKFFEKERLIVWAMQTNSANLDNDAFLVLDLKWGISSEMTFTTWSGKSFRPSAIEVFNNEIMRGDTRGFILKHKENLLSDPKINIYKSASDWISETIVWTIKTIHYNFGGTFFRKMPTRVLLTIANSGNTTVQINAIRDDGRNNSACKPIRVRNDFVWGDDEFVWRTSTFIWRGAGLIEQWRRFKAKALRLATLQLVITNGFSEITNSDTLGLATISGAGNTATLTAPNKWPLNCEDYYLATEVDGYVKEYLIDSRISDTQISIIDPLNDFPSGSKKWVIRGKKKGEKLQLLGFNIHWANVSQTQETYDSSAEATGKNA